ncbi:MAG TPA: Fe-S cluster assembly protein SufD [Rhodothermales bacterium]|nr:Fe-S cluster assembly protein SufD [Rhodothermales bacterium]
MAAPAAIEQPTRPEDRFVAAFEMQDGHTLNGSNANVQGLRREAIQAFAELGIPTRKAEAWKYTNIEKVLRHDYKLSPAGAPAKVLRQEVERRRIPGLEAHVVVLVNGRFDPDLSDVRSLPKGVLVSGFAQASEAHPDLVNRHFSRYADFRSEALTALNTAFTQDGAFVYVPRGVALDRPVHVVSITDASEDVLVQPRHLFVAEEGAVLAVVQSDHAMDHRKTLVNAVTEVYVGARACVDCYKLQDAGDDASAIDTTQVYQEAGSACSVYTATLSGGVVRNNLNFLPNGEQCESHLYGLCLGHGQMHVDNHTLVDHARPECQSNELYKNILDGYSVGVFNGKVFVRRDAQKINAYQSNKNIVLTDTAKIYAKPELEIYADDVRCSHGATTGQLDPEAVFYLRSRGIPETQARAMMLLAFARDVLDNVKLAPLRQLLDEAVQARFSG